MPDALLPTWQNFYVIVGSASGALVALQFVAVTLIAQMGRRPTPDALHAFGTPNVVHLSGALGLAALMCAPWPTLSALSTALTACGIAGLSYGAIVVARARRQTEYVPDLDDWIWYSILPCAMYALLCISAAFLAGRPQSTLFTVAGATLGLLLIGVRNSWDSVTHMVVGTPGGRTAAEGDQQPG